MTSQRRKVGLFFPVRLALSRLNQRRLGRFATVWVFLQRKRPAWVPIHAGLCCEPEGLSPDGGLFYSTNKESTPDRRAARSVAERRPWGRKRRKREAFRRAFPERHASLHNPARLRRAVRGAGGHPLPQPLARFQTEGTKAIMMGKISRRPSSMSKERKSLEKLL